MIKHRFIKTQEDAISIWQKRSYYKLENFQLTDLIRVFLYLNPKNTLRSRKKHYYSFVTNFGQYPVREISTSNINFWFQRIKKEQNLSERTLAQIKCQLNHLFKWLTFEGILISNPLTNIRIKRNLIQKKNRILFKEPELEVILNQAKEFDSSIFYPFLYTIIHTGARPSEIMKLKWEDIDLNGNNLYLRNTKNGDSRTIQMAPGLIKLFQRLKGSSQFLFPNIRGNLLGRAKIQRMMNKFKNHYSHTKPWNYHDLRHSFAYNFLRRGGEMYQLQAILGHKTIQMTVDLYGNLKSQDVKKPSPYSF